MYCKHCGNQIDADTTFCPHCGGKVSKPVEPQNTNIQANNTQGTSQVQSTSAPGKHKQKKPVYKRWWFWVIIAFVVLTAIPGEDDDTSSGTGNDSNPNSSISSNETTESPTEAVIEVSPAEIRIAYEENEIAADEKYDGKLIKVTGKVDNIGKDILDQVYITIGTGEYLNSIQCYFADDEQIAIVAGIKSGDEITIIGRCDGLALTNIIVKDCEIQ